MRHLSWDISIAPIDTCLVCLVDCIRKEESYGPLGPLFCSRRMNLAKGSPNWSILGPSNNISSKERAKQQREPVVCKVHSKSASASFES